MQHAEFRTDYPMFCSVQGDRELQYRELYHREFLKEGRVDFVGLTVEEDWANGLWQTVSYICLSTGVFDLERTQCDQPTIQLHVE